MTAMVYQIQDLPARLLGGCSVLLYGGSVVSYHYGITRRRAHRKAILALAKILEKNLTARYEP